ncbi:MAG: PEGA domain-containing protein [Acidobacteriota bacterium]
MSEVPPDQPVMPPEDAIRSAHQAHEVPEPSVMPGWVPALIGLVLLFLAALAVYTGVRRENSVITRIIHPRKQPRAMAPAPPGEPGPGSSLVFPGDTTENVPTANAPVTGKAHGEIVGGPGGVTGTLRFWARRGMIVDAVPDDAMVYVNELAIGEARQLNTPDEIYDFPAAGSYNVRISAPGYKERTFIVTAAETAKDEIARISVTLDKK